jgi:hypothetical protein
MPLNVAAECCNGGECLVKKGKDLNGGERKHNYGRTRNDRN